jgi:hypothetical protein
VTDKARRNLPAIVGALFAAAGIAGVALADDRDGDRGDGRGSSYLVGLWGDLPYSDQQETSGVPNLVADMNRAGLAFSVHDGDIKSGSSRCDDEVYEQFEGYLDSFRAPAMYTPGDNEWTDCDRENNGAFDSAERLGHVRESLFDTPYSHGRDPIRQEVQAAPYVENRRWQVGKVTYATLHVVGSDNNRSGDIAPDPVEWAARDEAANDWLRETFDAAERRRSAGIMLVIQANPGFDQADPTRAPTRDGATLEPADGFTNFLRALREETIRYGKPVVLVHGDSHYFRIDKPLLDAAGNRIENFTRLETPGDNAQSGDNDAQWVSVQVDAGDPEVFSFQQEVVPGNLPAYQP